jgi:type IV pilus assembly protein PilX
MKNRELSKQKQTGMVLVVSMIMLLLLTLIGVTGTQVTSLEEKMAGNSRDQNIAFQAAESTLKEAEIFILTNPIAPATYTGVAGLSPVAFSGTYDYMVSTSWSDANSVSTSASFADNFVNNAGVSITAPRYVIERLGGSSPNTFFKITARAQGISSGTQVVLQEVFQRTD